MLGVFCCDAAGLNCPQDINKNQSGLHANMRPVFAIAPLALAMALWGPASQARSGEQSWTSAFIEWVFARHTMTTLPEKAASSPTFQAPFQSR